MSVKKFRSLVKEDNVVTDVSDKADKATTYTKTETDAKIVANVENSVMSASTTKALSAKMGKELQDQIQNLKQRGRYLSIWNCATGLAKTEPTVNPYEYKAGDYFIVGTVGTVNYRPSGTSYDKTAPSTAVETGTPIVNDTYYFDGTSWSLLHTEQSSVSWDSIPDKPVWVNSDTKPDYTAEEVGAAPENHTHVKSEITDFPTTFPPSSHASSHGVYGSDAVTVAQSQVEGLEAALAAKLPTSAKLSELHDEAGNPTSDNNVSLTTDGGLESHTTTYDGVITLTRLSDDFTAYDANGNPYSSKPPVETWKGPFRFGNYTFYVPSSQSDPMTETEAASGWCLYSSGANTSLMYYGVATALIDGSITRPAFASISAAIPVPYAIVGQAFFTRARTTSTKTFASLEDISDKLDKSDVIKQSAVTSATPDGMAADAKDLKAQLDGKLDKSGGTMTGNLTIIKPSGIVQLMIWNDKNGVGFTVNSEGRVSLDTDENTLVIPTDRNGTLAFLSDILQFCQPFSEDKTGGYAVGEFCSYLDGTTLKLYQCTVAHTGAWNAAHFAARDVSALFSGANTSLMGVVRYAFNADGTIKDRAINAITYAGGALPNFPAQVSGYARDFLLNVTATATASDISLPETGATSVGDALAFTAGKTYLVAITEIAAKKYYIRILDTTPQN